ncbi:hypothetical protein BDF19DRAFT_415221 [Syncephalis fuscata]|nr:hypothetical protein BDF19DRAFT_415221 [Syncephalis fuscata]
MEITNWKQFAIIKSVLALVFIAQLASATPREVDLPDDPPQTRQSLIIPSEFDRKDEVSWSQHLNGMDVNTIYRIKDNFKDYFSFFQDTKRKQALLRGDPGRQYVVHPQHSFLLRGKRCFIMSQLSGRALNLHMEFLSLSDKAKSIPSFFIKLIRAISYIHKVGWANIELKASKFIDILVRLDSERDPIIDVMQIEQLKRIEFKNNAVLLIDPPQPNFLYLPEWIENTKIDPRKADLWRIGEILYKSEYNIYFAKTVKAPKQVINDLFSKMPDVLPNIGNTQQQFNKFMYHLKNLIKESYKYRSVIDNDYRSILLNTNGGLPENSIAASSSLLRQIYLTPEMIGLIRVAQYNILAHNTFQNYSRFITNGLFQLGIYGLFHIRERKYPDEYAFIFNMLDKLLAIDPKERLTPEQYLRQIDSNTNANRLHASVQQAQS